jgi:hypothetical protein
MCNQCLGSAQSLPVSLTVVQSAEVLIPKTGSRSASYENHTKPAQSGGWERTGLRESIFSPGQCRAVRRFMREARAYW